MWLTRGSTPCHLKGGKQCWSKNNFTNTSDCTNSHLDIWHYSECVLLLHPTDCQDYLADYHHLMIYILLVQHWDHTVHTHSLLPCHKLTTCSVCQSLKRREIRQNWIPWICSVSQLPNVWPLTQLTSATLTRLQSGQTHHNIEITHLTFLRTF